MNELELLQKTYKKRESKYFRKYDFGLVLVIGGGDFYTGSPALSAMAAYQAGSDMVRVISPQRAADIIASFSPDLAAYPLSGNWLTKEHLPVLLSQTRAAEKVSRGNVCVVIGGGAGRSEETKKAVREYLTEIEVPAVIDAAAIHALGEKTDIVKNKPFLITPHSYEFFVLTGEKIGDLSLEEKKEMVKKKAEEMGTNLLLKTGPDMVTDGDKIALSSTANPYLSVGGTGDTLAGICGSLIARGLSPFEAGVLGSFIVGKAGEVAGERLKDSLMASDVISAIPEVINLSNWE